MMKLQLFCLGLVVGSWAQDSFLQNREPDTVASDIADPVQCADTQCRNPDGTCPAGTQGVACSGLCSPQCGGGVMGCGCAGGPGPSPPPPTPPGPGSNQVWLSIGYGKASHSAMQAKWDVCQSYKKSGAITGTSLVMYHISSDGSLINDETGDPSWTAKQFQQDLKNKLGLKAVPLLMCGTNCPKSGRQAILSNPSMFVDALVAEVHQFGWDGLAMDFETPFDEWDGFTHIFNQLGAALHSVGKEFYIWWGAAGAYYNRVALSGVDGMWSMWTYGQSVSHIEGGSWEYTHGSFSQGVGLTRANQPENHDDMVSLTKWAQQRGNVNHFHVWDGADQFHDEWTDGFRNFINGGLPANASTLVV